MGKKAYFFSICLIGFIAWLVFLNHPTKKQSADLSSYLIKDTSLNTASDEGIDPEGSFSTTNSTEQDLQRFEGGDSSIETFLENVKAIKDGTSKINSIESFLKATPADLRSYYTLAFHSRSIQGSSFVNPRAIVFSKDVRLMYSFNGAKNQPGYNSLEFILFDDTLKEFEFREIDFSKPVGHQLVESPNKCLGCHATVDMKAANLHSFPHPLWDNYFIWPGIYGMVDDDIFRQHTKKFGYEGLDTQAFRAQSAEYQKYATYLQNAKTHARYSQLLPNKAYFDDNDGAELRPNIYLNAGISDMMGKVMAHHILNNPFLQAHQNDVLNFFEINRSKVTGIFKNTEDTVDKNSKVMGSLYVLSNESRVARLQKDFGGYICKQYERGCDEYKANQGSETGSLGYLKTLLDAAGLDLRSYATDLYPRTGSLHDGDRGSDFFYALPGYMAQEACGREYKVGKLDRGVVLTELRKCLGVGERSYTDTKNK